MEILVRGKYIITDANQKESGILFDGGVYVSDGTILEISSFEKLKNK